IAELYVIIKVGEAIGALPTIAILIADSLIGSWLLRSQGRVAWRRFNDALAAGRPPAREVLDGALVIFGCAFLLPPGFLTDIVSFAFGDPESALFGIARIGLSPAPPATASALAVMFSGREPVAARVQSGIEIPEPDWKSIEVAGVSARTLEPLARWQLAFAGDGARFELEFSALSEPLAFGVGESGDGPGS